MGGPSPDSISNPPMPVQALTLAEIIVRNWTVRARCGKCGLTIGVSLDALVRVHGPGMIMWGRTIRCPSIHDGRWRCEGRMDYLAQAIAGGTWVKLHELGDHEVKRIKAGKDPYTRRYVKPRDEPAEET